MEAVKIFNSELAGLYECKPPISKAKMTAITKAAIRAIKFYKHVVQSVEKFIQKCKTEYKIPGLYVIDSIVRQSRHQFSVEKDVFAPRFAKNITVTFYYLFKCPQEDKSKVIRVLNLWQKNQVFGEEVIQPLFDLADPNHSIHKDVANLISQKANKAKTISHPTQMHATSQQQQTPQYQHTPQHPPTPQQQQSQPHHQQQPQQQHSSQQQQPPVQPQHQQQLFSTLQTTTANATVTTTGVPTVSMSNQEPNSVTTASIVSSLDPNLIQQIQQILLKTEEGNSVASAVAALGLQQPHILPTTVSQNQQTIPPPPPPSISLSSQQISSSIALPIPPPVQEDKPGMIGRLSSSDYDGRSLSFLPVDTSQPPPGYHLSGFPNINPPPSISQVPPPPSLVSHHVCIPERVIDLNEADVVILSKSPREEGEHSDESDENKENQDDEIEEVGRRMRSRSRSASRSKRGRRRSKSPSDSRSRHNRRSRSKSRGRRSRSREKERERDRDKREREKDRGRKERERISYEKEKEKERERKKRGLPPMKKEYLSVCSTTLWVGHLSKLVHQEELSDTFGEYGDIVSIDLIPPRGCAFICMNRRQDAARALVKLKNHKMHNKAITLAWAPGKGVKGKEFKDYWEVDVGCSYIPFSKLSQMSNVDLDAFEDGGMIDEETVPQWLKGRYGANSSSGSASVTQNSSQRHLPPPMVNMNIPPPLSSRQEQTRPSMSAGPPPIEKDPRGDNRHTLPPPLLPPFALQGLPPPGGMTMGAPIMPPNLPPTLPPPLGVPPPLGIPSLNVPPVSSMMGQPLLGVPPHVSSVSNIHPPPIASPVNNNSNINAANIQDSDNMDVEMEDVEKQDPLSLNPPPPPVRDNLGIPERIMTLSGRGPSLEYNSRGREREVNERDEMDRFPDGLGRLRNHADSPNVLTKDAFHGQGGAEFRCEGFGTFGPRGLPIQRAGPPFAHPSGHIGIISRNGPNFGPRSVAQFGPQRGILPAPPTALLSGRPSLLADLSAGPPRALIASSGIGGPRALGVRPSPAIGGLIGGHLQPPRGLSGPPGILNRFGAPPGGFPRFGIITGPRSIMNPPHPPSLEEEPHDEWGEKPPGFLNIRPIERSNEVWHSDMEDIFAAGNRAPSLPSGSQRVEELTLRREDRHFEPPQQKESSQPPERTLDNVRNNKDPFVNGVIRQKEEESEIDRFRERDWDRNRDWEREKEWDRDKSWDREKEWDRHRDRDRDRERDKDWDRDRIRDRDRNRDRERDRERERERERWRSRDRERDNRERERDGEREREFSSGRYRGSFDRDREKDERIKERSYERPSRWSAEEGRDEKRHVEEEEALVEEGGEEEEEEESAMTWDNWATFATMSVAPPVEKKAKTDDFAPPSGRIDDDQSKKITSSVVGSISDNSHTALIGGEKEKVFSEVEEKNANRAPSPAGGLSALQDNDETSLPLDRNISPEKNCSNLNVFENIPRKLENVNSDNAPKLEMIEKNSENDPDDDCTNQSNVCRESMEADVQNVHDKDNASTLSAQEKITSKYISQEQHSTSTLSVQEVYSATISAQENDSTPLSVQEGDSMSLSVPKEESITAVSVHERVNANTMCDDDERGSALEKLIAPDVWNGNKQEPDKSCVPYEPALVSEVSLSNEPTTDDHLLEKEFEATLTNRGALPYHSEQMKLTRSGELQYTKIEISSSTIFGCSEQKCTNNEDTHFYDARGSEESGFFKHESDHVAHIEEQENTKITSADNDNYRLPERNESQNDFSNGDSKQDLYEPELKMSEHDGNAGNLCEQVILRGTQCGQDAGTLELSERNDAIEQSFSRSEGSDKAYISYRSSESSRETEADSAVPYYDLDIRNQEVKNEPHQVSDSSRYSENLCVSALSCLDELGESREACNSPSLDDRLFSVDTPTSDVDDDHTNRGNDQSLDIFHDDKEKLRCYIPSSDQLSPDNKLSSYMGDLSSHGDAWSSDLPADINRSAEGSEKFPQSGPFEEENLVTRASSSASHSFNTCEEEKEAASQFPPKSSVSAGDSLIGCVTPCSSSANYLGVNEGASSEASLDEIASQTDS